MALLDLVDDRERAGEMLAERGRCRIRIAALDRIDDGFMIADHGFDLSRERKVQEPQPVDMAALPADDLPQVRHAGLLAEQLMHRVIGDDKARIVARLHAPLLVDGGAQAAR